MKKVRILFASTACLTAAAGLYAKMSLATVYYIPFYTNRNGTGTYCEVPVSIIPCDGTGTLRCTYTAGYVYDQSPVTFVPVLSKRVDEGSCTAVFKDF